jgi:hypothetical protein
MTDRCMRDNCMDALRVVSCNEVLLTRVLLQSLGTWTTPASVTNKAAGSWLALLKNLWLTGVTLPSHFFCNQVA